MRAYLTIILISITSVLIGQKPLIHLNDSLRLVRLSWGESMGHSGNPDWRRLIKLFLEYDDIKHREISDTIARVLSYDLIIGNGNSLDSFHIINTNFARDYREVVGKIIPGSDVLIKNILCWTSKGYPHEFYFRNDNLMLFFRIL
jgi:hypothetical protein